MDDAAWDYCSQHHPLCHAIENLSSPDLRAKATRFLLFDDMRSEYSNTSYCKANIPLRNRIQMHGQQVESYRDKCLVVDSLVRAHLDEITSVR